MPINFCNRSRDLSPRLPQAPLVSDSKVGLESLIFWWPFPEEQQCHDEDGDWAGKGGSFGAGNPDFFMVKPSAVGESCWAGWAPSPGCSLLLAPLTPSCHRAFIRSRKRCQDLSLALSLCIPSNSVCGAGGAALVAVVCVVPGQVCAGDAGLG